MPAYSLLVSFGAVPLAQAVKTATKTSIVAIIILLFMKLILSLCLVVASSRRGIERISLSKQRAIVLGLSFEDKHQPCLQSCYKYNPGGGSLR